MSIFSGLHVRSETGALSAAAAPNPMASEEFTFEGSSCQVFLGVQYHCDLGDWHLSGPPSWDPNSIVAKADLYAMPHDVELIQTAFIRLGDIAPSPPINDTRNVSTLLVSPRWHVGIRKMIITYNVSSVGLPPLLGGRPAIIYCFGSVKFLVDNAFAFSKRYTNEGGQTQFVDNVMLLAKINSGG